MRIKRNASDSLLRKLLSPVTVPVWRLCDRTATFLQTVALEYGLEIASQQGETNRTKDRKTPVVSNLVSGLDYRTLEDSCPTTSSFSKALFLAGQSVRRITSVALKLANELSTDKEQKALLGYSNLCRFATEELKPALIEYVKSGSKNSQALETVLNSNIFFVKRNPRELLDTCNKEIDSFDIQANPLLNASFLIATLNSQLLSLNHLALIPNGHGMPRDEDLLQAMTPTDYIDNLMPALVIGTQIYSIAGCQVPAYFHIPLNDDVVSSLVGNYNPMSLETSVNLLQLLRVQSEEKKNIEIYKKDPAFDNFVRIQEGIAQDYDPATIYYYEVCATLIEELQHAQDSSRCPPDETQTDSRFTDGLTKDESTLRYFHSKVPGYLNFTGPSKKKPQLIKKADADRIIKELSGNIARIALIKDPRFGLKSIYANCTSLDSDVIYIMSHLLIAGLWVDSIFPEKKQNTFGTDLWKQQSPIRRIMEKFNNGENVLLPLMTKLNNKELKFPIELIAKL